jgi:LysR family glycine cleavage system transcriptional activator
MSLRRYVLACLQSAFAFIGAPEAALDLANHVLIHSYWSPDEWQRWLAAGQRRWREVLQFKVMQHLRFREELHALDAVIAGQGIGIFSDALAANSQPARS